MSTQQKLSSPIFKQKNELPLFTVLWRVYHYLKPYWKHTAGAYVSLLAILGLSALIPQFIRWIIDNGIDGNRPEILTWSALALIGLTLMKGVFNYLMGIWSETASQNVAYDLRNDIQRKLTLLSFSFHDQSETGELLSRAVQDVERIRFLTGRATIRILDGALTLIITSVIMLMMDYRLALLVLITMPLLVYVAIRFGSKYRPLSLKVQKQLAALTTAVEQNLRGSRIVKAYAQEDAEISRFAKENNQWFDLSFSAAKLQAINVPFLFLIANLSIVAIILYGGYQVINDQLTIGAVIAFITYVGQLVEPVRRLGMIIPAVAIASSAAERVFDILDTVSEVKDEPGAGDLPVVKGNVKFDHVYFSYGDRPVLSDVNFEVQEGQVVALLGATGSGKSSIISLLPRFYDPTAGRILFDGFDIRRVSLQSLRSQIGIVLQETTLFATTIKQNIAFGCERASDKDIILASKAAQAHEFIIKMAKGYETRVGERGVTLSGGQKQRLAIARAILMDPRILILDDATASVDTETEHLIQLALEELIRDRTTFVIAHRLSTVQKADLIIVLDSGRISASGTHNTLLQTSQIYRDIYNQQLKNQENLK